MRMVSPKEMHQQACKMMLDGRKPQTTHDWQMVVNFYAANIAAGMEEAAVPLICLIMNCPLPKELVVQIAQFQAVRKKGTERAVKH